MAKQKTRLTRNWLKMQNPLLDLTAPQIETMMQQSRCGNDAQLQWAFEKMIEQFPVFQSLRNARLSELVSREWAIETIDESDKAKLQKDIVEQYLHKSETFTSDSFTDLIHYLGDYIFSGRAVVKPYFDDDGNIRFKRIPNIYTSYINETLYYKTEHNNLLDYYLGDTIPDSWTKIPTHEVVSLFSSSPIDFSAIQIYLRDSIGNTQWARMTEKQGVPQVVLTAPANTPDSMLDEYTRRAMAIFEGGSGVLPGDTNVQELTAARGQDPFTSFLEWNLKNLAILVTGGTALCLPTSAGLGGDLAKRQEEFFRTIVDKDAKIISNAISNIVLQKILDKEGLGESLIRFTIKKHTPDVSDIIEIAKACKELGFEISREKFEEQTGISFLEVEKTQQTNTTTDGETWTPAEEN